MNPDSPALPAMGSGYAVHGMAGMPMGPPAMGGYPFGTYGGGFAYGQPRFGGQVGYGQPGVYGGQGGYGGYGGSRALATAPAPTATPTPAATPSAKSRPVLDPEKFRPPPAPYTDQTLLGHRGSRPRFPMCLRCGRVRDNHPEFVDCLGKCDICKSHAHWGKPCDRIWASKKSWSDHHQPGAPEYVQLRPSPSQREQLALLDPWFLTNPPSINEDLVTLAQGVKRKGDDEHVKAGSQRRHHLGAVNALKHKLGAAEMLQHKHQKKHADEMVLRLNAEKAHRAALDEIRAKERERVVIEREKDSLEARHKQLQIRARDYEEEISSLKDKLRRRDAAHAESASSRPPALNAIKKDPSVDAPSPAEVPARRIKKEEEDGE
ncbi:hypothetical protein TUN199_00285 [Pyrenophora tritici-repentis]|uniref:FAP multi-domain protein n=1 Tax=Pyrenophora tritici-repentis TaxID=45151 RepID=A0A316ZZ60_9PLEO|nr:hypothetical protein A1F99_119420 [Pyrenophora tritici-repentis]KAF7566405.1 FAP multi-domain protein [Pyrenophora tritici-repentis]KAI0615195.1 hypothetical protein TUN205_00603 [Pyrenophora tritici-repentis]KAI0627750.1 hypothetical protein TUN199_00285 [Pyrenophora tritici-repentis]KAI1666195.1 hypothetical protein L13192_09879 [Pyrenophora tritici-repentis]